MMTVSLASGPLKLQHINRYCAVQLRLKSGNSITSLNQSTGLRKNGAVSAALLSVLYLSTEYLTGTG